MLGSIDCNTGDTSLGWDTDQFLMDEVKATRVLDVILSMNGLTAGGLNFDCKVRRESTDLEGNLRPHLIQDLFIAHIGSMDIFAKGLRNAAWSLEHGKLKNMVKERYSSWASPLGLKVHAGKSSFEELEAMAKQNPIQKVKSGKQGKYWND
jgi:xylose isomerase